MRRVVLPLLVAGLAACTYIYGLDDLAGEPGGDAGIVDGSEGGPSPVAEGGGGTDAPVDSAELDARFEIDCSDGVIAHWSMEDDGGAIVRDRCPLRLDGELLPEDGGVAWSKRGASGCIELKGNAHVFLGARNALQLPGPLTVAGFIRPDTFPDGFVGVFWGLAGPAGFELIVAYNGKTYAQVGIAGQAFQVDIGDLVAGEWAHLAFVFEPNVRLEVFRDGKSVAKGIPPSGSATINPNAARLGPVYSSSTWNGALDDVIVYARALSASEIDALSKR